MTKKELKKVLQSPDFSNQVNGGSGIRYCYKGRYDIYIRSMFGNYFIETNPLHSGVHEYMNINSTSHNLYLGTEEDPTEETLSEKDMYSVINKYVDCLESTIQLVRKKMDDLDNVIHLLRYDNKHSS